MNKKLIFTVVLLIYIILLFLGAFVFKIGGEAVGINGFDKIQHFIGFLVLTLLLLFTFDSYKLSNRYVASSLIALGIGIIIEGVQLGIPGREFSLLDILADILGIILALVLKWSFSKR